MRINIRKSNTDLPNLIASQEFKKGEAAKADAWLITNGLMVDFEDLCKSLREDITEVNYFMEVESGQE